MAECSPILKRSVLAAFFQNQIFADSRIMENSEKATLLRELPSVDELLNSEVFLEIDNNCGRASALRIARAAVDIVRARIANSENSFTLAEIMPAVLEAAAQLSDRENLGGITRVINATGVVIHTNLGRSALSGEAINAIVEQASGYCTLEYDLETGKRGKRGSRAEALICEVTGAESAVIVNNCAAAAFLVLRVLAAGMEVIISRGELVEIGGDFRIPDVLAESGATMREVGTTNRTKLRDYEQAINENTGLILRVHPSNYRVIGFTESPSNSDLAALSKSYKIPFFEDAGSGAIADLSEYGLGDEPLISRSIADGVDVVAFSGDKLLGGVQAGFVVGSAKVIGGIRRHPLYRALRLDKLAYAAIEATLGSYLRGRQGAEVPTLRMIAMTEGEIRARAERVVSELSLRAGNALKLEIVEGESAIGGGSAPDLKPRTWLISVSRDGRDAAEVEHALRKFEVPVIARIQNDRVVIDLRTVFEDDEQQLMDALAALAG
jgi:L-seryl-tRNA(Ser) seleniumtransferase